MSPAMPGETSGTHRSTAASGPFGRPLSDEPDPVLSASIASKIAAPIATARSQRTAGPARRCVPVRGETRLGIIAFEFDEVNVRRAFGDEAACFVLDRDPVRGQRALPPRHLHVI